MAKKNRGYSVFFPGRDAIWFALEFVKLIMSI